MQRASNTYIRVFCHSSFSVHNGTSNWLPYVMRNYDKTFHNTTEYTFIRIWSYGGRARRPVIIGCRQPEPVPKAVSLNVAMISPKRLMQREKGLVIVIELRGCLALLWVVEHHERALVVSPKNAEQMGEIKRNKKDEPMRINSILKTSTW